jgi:hypothetical protein
MRHVLTEQLVKKVLSQGACRPSCGDTDAKSTQIPNNETGGEYVQEVEYQAVNGTSKGRAVLACCLLIEFCGRFAENKSHQRESSTNDDGTCEPERIKYAIRRTSIREDAL